MVAGSPRAPGSLRLGRYNGPAYPIFPELQGLQLHTPSNLSSLEPALRLSGPWPG
jgi:hypothetical protein